MDNKDKKKFLNVFRILKMLILLPAIHVGKIYIASSPGHSQFLGNKARPIIKYYCMF